MSEARNLFIGGHASEKTFRALGYHGRVQTMGVATLAAEDEDHRAESWDRLSWFLYRYGKVDAIHIHPEMMQNEEFLRTLGIIDGIFFTGGSQEQIVTPQLRFLMPYIVRNLKLISGSSAGTAIAGEWMISDGEVIKGLGVKPEIIVDQHFSEKDRKARLQNAVAKIRLPGVGVDEDTAIHIDGSKIEIAGSGKVYTYVPQSHNGDQSFYEESYRPGDSLDYRSLLARYRAGRIH